MGSSEAETAVSVCCSCSSAVSQESHLNVMREKGKGSSGSGIHSCCNLLLLLLHTHTRPPQKERRKKKKKKNKRRRKNKLLPLQKPKTQNPKPKTLAPFSSPFIASFFSVPPLLADRTMATDSANLSSSPPLPEAPCHRSPPRYPDFYGKHRKQVELQILNREIGFLKEELQSIGDLKPASSCCKEVDEFVGTNPDPLILQNLKIHRPFRIWKWLCGKSCFNASWICCSSGCLLHLERPCCACDPSRNCQCCCRRSDCCLEKPCCRYCCPLSSLSCSDCSCRCVWSCVECRKVCHCQTCTRNCCLPCCLCS